MKRVVMLSLLCFSAILSYAQTKLIVDDVDISSITNCYLEIQAINGGVFKTKIIVVVDYGQEKVAFDGSQVIKNEKGERIKFKSQMDAINFIANFGWRVKQYSIENPDGAGPLIHHYILEHVECNGK